MNDGPYLATRLRRRSASRSAAAEGHRRKPAPSPGLLLFAIVGGVFAWICATSGSTIGAVTMSTIAVSSIAVFIVQVRGTRAWRQDRADALARAERDRAYWTLHHQGSRAQETAKTGESKESFAAAAVFAAGMAAFALTDEVADPGVEGSMGAGDLTEDPFDDGPWSDF